MRTPASMVGIVSVLVAGCGSPTVCGVFIGDGSKLPEASLIALRDDGTVDEIAPGDPVSLQRPPQGGYVVYIGARVRNVSSCNVDFQGQFLDSSTGILLGFDRRQAKLALGADGWGRPVSPQTSNLPNVALCPDNFANDTQGRSLTLEMKITDSEGRTVTLSAPVEPRCRIDDPGLQFNCLCTCSANYFPGKCGFGDGGVSDGG